MDTKNTQTRAVKQEKVLMIVQIPALAMMEYSKGDQSDRLCTRIRCFPDSAASAAAV